MNHQMLFAALIVAAGFNQALESHKENYLASWLWTFVVWLAFVAGWVVP